VTESAKLGGQALPGDRLGRADRMTEVFGEHWWAAVASIARRIGDLEVAEDAVQEACAAAVVQWPVHGVPPNPRAWLIATAWHKAVDVLRRESARGAREAEAAVDLADHGSGGAGGPVGGDELALIFACCHPALAPEARVALTLRSVCGLSTAEIAAAFVVPETTMAQRIVRAKRKIRQAGIPLAVPKPDDLPGRLNTVLRVVYLVFTQGHRATSGPDLVRGDLCDRAIWLARQLAAVLPAEPDVTGLLALFLLIDARRAARTAEDGSLILLADQDRGLWDNAAIAEGEALIEAALAFGRPGPYQLHAAIAACHSLATSAESTDWGQIAALYGALSRFEPTPIVAANHAVAVAMADGPGAGLAILDKLTEDGRLDRWPQLHIARAELLQRLGRDGEALAAYRAALSAGVPTAEQDYIARRMAAITTPLS
jgi:RNA polymerase sigma-70 factor, ECF subfamily